MTFFLQLLVQGLALGATYALIAIGFVIVFKASGVLNFAHGHFMMLGAYLVAAFGPIGLGLNFWIAIVISGVLVALLGIAVERGILRHMIGRPIFSIIMVTLGLDIVVRRVTIVGFGVQERSIGNPWSNSVMEVGSLRLGVNALMTLLICMIVMALFFVFFRYTKLGLSMRATSLDPETAMAVGVNVRKVFATAWALAGLAAVVAGTVLAGFPRVLEPAVGAIALRAFPAVIVGGIDSIHGPVIAGLLIGMVEVLVAGYQPQYAPWLGQNFHVVAAYLVMFIILWVRPYGLFGTREVIRV